MERTKRDINQIQQFEHDEKSNAKRVKMVGTEISIELDHKDGDSVTSHPAKLSASILGIESSDSDKQILPVLDCSSIRTLKIHLDGEGAFQVLLSPSDEGDYFYEASSEDLLNLCAKRIKIFSKGVVGDIYLVGRS